jgi:hypothetical protein
MRLPRGTLADPFFDQSDLRRLDLLVRIRRGHHLVLIRRKEALEEAALVRLAFDDGRFLPLLRGEETGFGVETQARFARARIGAVAVEAGVREDGADVLVKADGLGLKSGAQSKNGQEGERAALHGWDVV